MSKRSPERLGDMSALVRASSSATDAGREGLNRRRKLVAMFCTMLGRDLFETKGNETDHSNGGTNGKGDSHDGGNGHGDGPMISTGPALSRRERQTLELLLDGDAEKQIATRLAISQHTVHVYVKSLYKRFGVNSRPELLAKWVKR